MGVVGSRGVMVSCHRRVVSNLHFLLAISGEKLGYNDSNKYHYIISNIIFPHTYFLSVCFLFVLKRKK